MRGRFSAAALLGSRSGWKEVLVRGGGRRDPTGQGGKSSRRESAAWLCFASVGAKGRVRWCAESLPRKDAAEGKREGRGR